MITIMKINENIMSEVVMVTMCVTDHKIAKHFEWVLHWSQYLQDHTPNLGRNSFQIFYEQEQAT